MNKCPYCGTPINSLQSKCWSCGKEVPVAAQREHSLQTSSAAKVNGSRDTNDAGKANNESYTHEFFMGFLAGPIGLICATITGKRAGFWSAFRGLLLALFVMCIFMLAISAG